MPPKKSMKSVSANIETKSVPKNIFAALMDDDESKIESKIESEPSNTTNTNTEIINDELIRTGNMVVAENTTNDDTKLNGSNKINLAEFVSNIKQKRNNGDRDGDRYRNNLRNDDKLLEHKRLYDDNAENNEMGNDLKLNSHWTVWVHKSDNPDWTLHGYQKRYIINNIGSFWRFFNNFQFYDCYKNQLFIMRGEIAPIWEDINNKFGGICSIKVDSTQRGFKTDISTEIFVSICMLIMNETFIVNNEDINGISYAVKKKNILIKIWTKTFYENDKFKDELPKPLINKFNSELQKQLMNIFGPDYKMSIQYKQIKPEYEI